MYILQYRHRGNPLAHYDGTAEEIINQCNGKLCWNIIIICLSIILAIYLHLFLCKNIMSVHMYLFVYRST